MDGFKKFLLRGNVVDLAVAVVIGAAFGAVVTAFVSGILTPLIAAIGGQPNFDDLAFHLHKSTFAYGKVLDAIISFVILATVVYFLVVLPVNTLIERFKPTAEAAAAGTKDCPHCMSSIPQNATVCAFCTRDVPASTLSDADDSSESDDDASSSADADSDDGSNDSADDETAGSSSAGRSAGPAKRTTAKRTPAKRAPGRPAGSGTARKTTAKKTTARKTTAKKTAAKRTQASR